MATAVVIGLASGVQVMAARRKGEGRDDETAVPLNGGLLLALAAGLPLTLVLYLLAPRIIGMLNGDPGVIEQGVAYLQVRLFGIVAVGINFSFRGYWTAVNRPGLYMRTLIVMHLCNVAISYVLIFGKLGLPALGTLGAGIGTASAMFIGSAIHFYLASRQARGAGFLGRVPGRDTMATMVRLAVPSAVQQFLFAAGITALFWIIGLLGPGPVAAATVLINLILVALLPGMGLGLAWATLVGQAMGRGDSADAARWGWEVAGLAGVFIGAIGLIGVVVPDLLLSGFLHDPEILAMARGPLRLTGATIAVDAAGLILLNALCGAGAAAAVMRVSVTTQWAIGLPAAWLAGPYLGMGLTGIWVTFVGYRLVQAAIFAALWRRGAWAAIRV